MKSSYHMRWRELPDKLTFLHPHSTYYLRKATTWSFLKFGRKRHSDPTTTHSAPIRIRTYGYLPAGSYINQTQTLQQWVSGALIYVFPFAVQFLSQINMWIYNARCRRFAARIVRALHQYAPTVDVGVSRILCVNL